MNTQAGMVIIGAGQCGARAAQALRENGWDGAITLLGDEGRLPYERPPLSKSVLLGQKTTQACALHDEAFYASHGIDLRTDAPATAIRREDSLVTLADGSSVPYRRLLVATGGVARTLSVPGGTLHGVHTLRNAADAEALKPILAPGRRIVVVGAGFIGLEVAASAVARGCVVTVIEVAPCALARAVPEPVADWLIERHRERGVEIRFCARLAAVLGDHEVHGVQLDDGTVIDCDAVIAGIGIAPRVSLAQKAGLEIADGIVTDAMLRTSDSSIFAAGDVCAFIHPVFGRRVRLECWKNAEDHARTAARNMLGHEEPCAGAPWFWSDQYDITLQIAGLPAFGTTTVVREAGAGSRVYFALDDEGVLVGASGVGTLGGIAKDIRVAQVLIVRHARVAPARLADSATKLRALLLEAA
jgi:3-phenylpropionate/trans-cinnamate dioxygenase ferredoxin reductase component